MKKLALVLGGGAAKGYALYPSAINLKFAGSSFKCLNAIRIAMIHGPTPRLSDIW